MIIAIIVPKVTWYINYKVCNIPDAGEKLNNMASCLILKG